MSTPSKKTMFNYFTKLPSKSSIVEIENPRKSAPVFNKQHVEEFQARLVHFDEILSNLSNNSTGTTYFNTIKSGEHKPYKYDRKIRGSLRARLLQFSEDVRPPYFGTWQKDSKLISGRRPFCLDTDAFDYDVDSEAEWDIGGPGESLKGDDSEEEEELDDYEIDMKTFVPHGYVSDDELAESEGEQNTSTSNSKTTTNSKKDCDDAQNDSDSDIKIIADTRPIEKQTLKPPHAPQPAAQAPQVKQTPKMDIKAITLGLSFEDNPTISESKIQFLKTFQGVSCT